jgi:hypothetical protein
LTIETKAYSYHNGLCLTGLADGLGRGGLGPDPWRFEARSLALIQIRVGVGVVVAAHPGEVLG